MSESGNVEREIKSPVIATSTPTLTGFTDCKMFDNVWERPAGVELLVITYYANGTKLWGICRL